MEGRLLSIGLACFGSFIMFPPFWFGDHQAITTGEAATALW
jgi:hypothetical protein